MRDFKREPVGPRARGGERGGMRALWGQCSLVTSLGPLPTCLQDSHKTRRTA